MVANSTYDLARLLSSALKATAPYVGIPMPGHTPLIFKRSKLQHALCGVKPESVEVQIHQNNERSLVVHGTAGKHCRTFMRMFSLHREAFYNPFSEQGRAMEKWNPVKSKSSHTSKYDKALAKLKKQLSRLGSRPEINNPCLSCSTVTYSERPEFLAWRRQKTLRRKIGALAVQARKEKITSREFYVSLAKLTTVKRYSDFTEKQRERIIGKIPFGYNGFYYFADPCHLWKFLPDLHNHSVGNRPKLFWGNWKEYENYETKERWGMSRYQPVLEWLRERQEILSQMQGIHDMQ